MPKQTFFNLPDEKRQMIEQAAAEEFAENGYGAASISQIVSRAGIAKGSFYQYFEDKRDVFMFLVERVGQEKMAYFKNNPPPDTSADFFARLRWMFAIGFEYAAAQSRLNQAVSRVLFGEGLFMEDMFKEMRESSAQMFVGMIQQASERGEIDPNVDPTIGAFVVETLLNSLGLFVLKQQQVDPEDLKKGSLDWLSSETARQTVEKLLHVLEYGLRKK